MQEMLPIALGPYCTKPVAVVGECGAEIGQIKIADGAVGGVAQPLDHRVLQGAGELPLQDHLGQLLSLQIADL
jgi:hypothetical protein